MVLYITLFLCENLNSLLSFADAETKEVTQAATKSTEDGGLSSKYLLNLLAIRVPLGNC